MSANQSMIIGAFAPRPATDTGKPVGSTVCIGRLEYYPVSLREEAGQAKVDGERVSWHPYRRRREGLVKVSFDGSIRGSFPI